MTGARSSSVPALAAALTVGAGLVHSAAAGTHSGDNTLVALFAVTALVQVALGIAVFTRPGRLSLGALAAVDLASFGAWLLTRTVGIPFIAALADVEQVGFQDLTANVLGLAGAVAAVVALVSRAPARRASFSPLWGLALLPALAGMAAPHVHSAAHEHDEAAAHSHADGHSHAAAAREPVDLSVDPVFAGAHTEGVSPGDLAAAKALIDKTREHLAGRYADEAALKAAGYRSIGDGFPLTHYEHYVNWTYLTDGKELDPERVESIVVEGTGSSARIVSAMYILESGKTMADVPDLAGSLTPWHDHQNLCWDDSGTRIAGVLIRGACVPGGSLKPTPPMLHVWLVDHPCGPFAGIEGHGQGCGGHPH